MSDPNNSGPYECHGPMMTLSLDDITKGQIQNEEVAAFYCDACGVWRHGYPIAETQLRAVVESRMPSVVTARVELAKNNGYYVETR